MVPAEAVGRKWSPWYLLMCMMYDVTKCWGTMTKRAESKRTAPIGYDPNPPTMQWADAGGAYANDGLLLKQMGCVECV